MNDPVDVLALDNQICFALYAANRAVTSRYRPLLTELGLTYPQYLVMMVLWEANNAGRTVRVSDLGERLRLDSGTLTPLLKRMEAGGLLRRARSVQDERVVAIELTDAGLALRKRAAPIPEKLLCGLKIDPERAQVLRKELRALLKLLDQAESSDQ